MDGRGRCFDSSFIKLLWQPWKQVAVYFEVSNDGFQARRVITGWMDLYYAAGPYSALAGQTLQHAYYSED